MQSVPEDNAVLSGPFSSFHTYWGSWGLSAAWERLSTPQHILLHPSSAADSSLHFLTLFLCSCVLLVLMKIISRLPLCSLYLSPTVFLLIVASVLTECQCFFAKEVTSTCKKYIELEIAGVDWDEVKGTNCQAVNWPLWAVCLWKELFSFLSEKHFVKGTVWAAGGWSRLRTSELPAWGRPENIPSNLP